MIRTSHVTKHYGRVRGVEDVSFEVPKHSSVVIYGPSGSGKTTLLRLIAGLELPDDGEIFINGTMASKPGWALVPNQRNVGFAFQAPALWPHMTVSENVLFGLHGRSKSGTNEELEELLSRMSLTQLADRYPHQISGGEARRAALARALAPRPRCLLLDEPLTSLDPDLKNEMITLIKERIHSTAACMVYVTHDSTEAKQVAERVVMIKNGRLEATSIPPEERPV